MDPFAPAAVLSRYWTLVLPSSSVSFFSDQTWLPSVEIEVVKPRQTLLTDTGHTMPISSSASLSKRLTTGQRRRIDRGRSRRNSVREDLLCQETLGRGRPKALCYEDILLMVVRHPETGRDVLAMAVKFIHHKGADNRPKPQVPPLTAPPSILLSGGRNPCLRSQSSPSDITNSSRTSIPSLFLASKREYTAIAR
jgi:hypothetical protein